jgi:opacity protein-like surface antigen
VTLLRGLASRVSRWAWLLALGSALPATAGEFELAGWGGPAFPTFKQSFRYDPGIVKPPIPNLSVTQQGSFSLEATGGLAIGGGVGFYVVEPIGFEARLDTVDIDVKVVGARYDVSVDLPAPLPDFSTGIDLTTGTVDAKRIHPVSFNLKLRTPGRVRLFLSGGASYLPSLEATAVQTIALGVTGVTPPSSLQVGTLALRAEALPGDGYGKWGVNGGAGLQLQIAPRLTLLAEGRYFHFEKRTLVWSRADDRTLSRLEQAFLTEVLKRLPSVSFDPQLWQATAGIAVTF